MKSPTLSRLMKFHPYPTNQVVAIIDEPEQVSAALSQLERKGIADRDIKVLSGTDGANRLDASGARHGVAGKLIRFFQGYGDIEQAAFARQAEELRAGHILIGVHVRNPVERGFVANILERCHGHFINFFGAWTIEGLAP